MSDLADLPGLGPKSAAMLADANIRTVATLRKLGAVQAFLAVKRCDPRASLNLLWALEGALTGRHWQDVAREDRARLLMALDDAMRFEAR
ncbi:MAG: TfoX/Sxy family protein [Burkholderiales bacterium]|nr:TfoX/Sxy family protein [Burkholderiales bacterium]